MSTTMKTAASDANDDVSMKALTQNICEAIGIPDAQLIIVIDKNNRTHVLTGNGSENLGADTGIDAALPTASFGGGRLAARADFGGGRSSSEIRHEPDGCWWWIRGERDDDGNLIEASRMCIGAQGCPVGETR